LLGDTLFLTENKKSKQIEEKKQTRPRLSSVWSMQLERRKSNISEFFLPPSMIMSFDRYSDYVKHIEDKYDIQKSSLKSNKQKGKIRNK